MAVRKIKAGRVNSITLDQFVGEQGTIFYDDETGELRLADGSTAGGILNLTYNLPIASNVILGGVILGPDFSISNSGVLSIASNISPGSGGLTATGDGGNASGGFYMLASLDGGHA